TTVRAPVPPHFPYTTLFRSVCDYVNRLAKVQEKVSDRLVLIPRIYTNKPRTTGEGYKGMVHQPDPEKKPDMLAGIIAIRKMHMRDRKSTRLNSSHVSISYAV